jgi:5-methyltetrahydrofolate--homocysteine methyltransferase
MTRIHSTLEELLASGPVVTDGGWGTQLQRLGLPLGENPEVWNLEHPELVERVARDYVAAGSRVILTNTFGGNRLILARRGLDGRAEEINRAGAAISLRAATGRAKVFASMGPSGRMLLMGETTPDVLANAFDEQAQWLSDAGVDGIVIETMSDPAEAALAAAAARRTGLPVVACMTFGSGKNKDRTLTGATPEQAAEALLAAGADIVGGNCGVGIAEMVEVCRRLHAASNRPVWVKPNAGLPEMDGERIVYRQTAEEFAAHMPRLIEAGAGFIGGCCGTTPEFIRAVVARLQFAR